jgi:anaerobic selenocysteine-containing dehydrogenase
MDAGAKLIVVDPRLTRAAARADLWLQLRPGTDAALVLGMINVIITENLYDINLGSNLQNSIDNYFKLNRVQVWRDNLE